VGRIVNLTIDLDNHKFIVRVDRSVYEYDMNDGDSLSITMISENLKIMNRTWPEVKTDDMQ
jgi:hypothetical protein